MGFRIDLPVFAALPNLCIGAVVARGIDNTKNSDAISDLLRVATQNVREKFTGADLKTHPDVACFREAFRTLGYNPNKFPSSVEALTSRVIKGHDLPDINPVVNLINAVSLKYTLPMGAHDLGVIGSSVDVRFSSEGERFTPLGESDPEDVPCGELVYAAGPEIRTRRWIWRQNDKGKVTTASEHIFFPIDGFSDMNKASIERAMDELARHLMTFFGVRATLGIADRERPEIQL